MRISVICVFNNKKQLDQQLAASLQFQKVDYEFITIDNTKKVYSSASKALNHGALISSGDILIFAHQDIYFKTANELEELSIEIDKRKVGTIIGTQGVREPSNVYYTNLTSGIKYNSSLQTRYEKKLYEVSCVDEGLFGMKRATWERHNFDEVLCDNWHLYCVESCLYNRKYGNSIYVYPSHIHHFSRGTISLGYMKNLKLLCKVYRKNFKYIWTTCYKVRTNPVYINSLVAIWTFNRIVKRRRLY